jgi:4-amino-4-deoxy-L-arabinose transferase-like glycosyltransferase
LLYGAVRGRDVDADVAEGGQGVRHQAFTAGLVDGRREPVDDEAGRATAGRGALSTRRALPLAGCLALASILAFSQLGTRPFSSPGEARYAMIAREMLNSGDWAQPHLNGVRYYAKPPLLYWSVATAYRLFGQTEAAARVPSAAAYVATVAITFFLADALLGPSAAPLAALIFATAAGPVLFGRLLSTDTLLTLWLSVSLLGLAHAVRGRPGPLGASLFWGGLSLGVLTKGLVGVVFPLGTAIIYALLADAWRLVRDLRPRLGAGIVALVFVPWHLVLGVRDPDFFRVYFVNEHLLRFFNARVPLDYTSLSIGGFWLATLLWFFPWVLFLPVALAARDLWRPLALPLIWAACVLLFFTLSAARVERYGLPALPALAVVVAAYWRRAFEARPGPAGLRGPAGIVLGGGALLAWLTAFGPSAAHVVTRLITLLDDLYREYFASHPEAVAGIIEGCLRLVGPFSVLLLLLGGATWLASRRPRVRLALTIWLIGAVGIAGFVELGHRVVAPDLSQRDLASIIRELWTPQATLVVWGTYEDYCGVSLYTGYPTLMIDGAGGDLFYGASRGDAPERFLTRAEFQRLWVSHEPVFVVGARGLEISGAVLFAGPRAMLVTNQSPPTTRRAGATQIHARSPDARDRSGQSRDRFIRSEE